MFKFIKNNLGFSIIGAIILIAFIAFWFVPGNAIHNAPALNKGLFFVFIGAAAIWAVLWSKDSTPFKKVKNNYYLLNLVVFLALLILSFLILIVWHSGPIGTTTNPA